MKKNKILIYSIIILFVSFGCIDKKPNKDKTDYETYLKKIKVLHHKGSELMENGLFDSTIILYNRIIEMDTTIHLYDAYINRGSSYLQKKIYNLALKDINYAIEEKANEKICYNIRMRIYFEKKEFKLALKDANKFIALTNANKTNIDSMIQSDFFAFKSECELNIGNIDLALESANTAIVYNSDYALGYYQRALAYFELGEEKLACEDIRKAKEIGVEWIPEEVLGKCK